VSSLRAWIAVYAAAALAIGVGVGALNLPRLSRLEAHGASAQARVTSTDCGNHGRVAYDLRVGEQTYAGSGNAGFRTPACDRLKPGDPIVVRYLVADPAQSLPGNIDDRLWNEWVSVLLAALGLPLVGVVIARRWLRGSAGSRAG